MIGPLVLSPLSEIYGRLDIINYANLFFAVSHVGAALSPNIGALLAFRLLSGLGGSACLSVGGGIITDLFDTHQRGVPNTMLTLGSMFGPVLGPLLGGAIAQHAGWRWIFWALVAASAVVWLATILLAHETNPTTIIRLKTRHLSAQLGRPDLHSAFDAGKEPADLTATTVLASGFVRPWKMLLRSPIMALLSTLVGFTGALLYLLLTTTAPFFRAAYAWPLDTAGLAYLGLGAGSLVGLVLFACTSDLAAARLTKANDGLYKPEMRMVTAIVPALFIPVSFFWYGWSAQVRAHWLVPLLALAPFGFAMVGVNATAQAYLIDAAGPYAASAVACVTAVRCLFGGLLPLVGPSLFNGLGLGWGNSVLGCVSLAMVPFPVVVYRYGGWLRERFPLDAA